MCKFPWHPDNNQLGQTSRVTFVRASEFECNQSLLNSIFVTAAYNGIGLGLGFENCLTSKAFAKMESRLEKAAMELTLNKMGLGKDEHPKHIPKFP